MMYRCENCGHLFEEGEQARWTEEHSEKWDGCPLCRGGYEEVHQCKECGDWHAENELYDGWCEKCLRETIDYDTFFEYCEANKDGQYLDIFVMSELLGEMDCPDKVSDEFHQLMIWVYKTYIQADYTCEPLSACIRFIMDYDGSIGRENYADWLNSKKEVK